ncbi:MAG: aldo/keto reductase [Candidatus Paceibacterota bacterium]
MSITENEPSNGKTTEATGCEECHVKAWTRPQCWDQEWIRHPFIKRGIDLLGATVGLVLLSPLFATIAICVRMTSPGPVFYRGLRTGRFARPFRIFKFRTMVQNAEQLGGTTTGANDARITWVGYFLRRYKLDELPQLLNVIVGDISLVGPRPEVYEYTTKFNERQQVILAIRPGITDLSSLHFIDLQSHVGEEDPDKVFRTKILPMKNRLRVKYVLEQSVSGDLKILWWTVVRLFVRKADGRVAVRVPEVNVLRNAVDIPRIPLGTSSREISRCGMGCWAVGGHGWGDVDERQSIDAIQTAWDLGINHFDTADVYGKGHSETVLSKALGPARHDAMIATKFGVRVAGDGNTQKDLSPRYCVQAVEASLRRLKIESIPLYYAHWPDGKTSVETLMDSLLRLREAGKIQSIGLSNFSAEQIREALRIGRVDAIQMQYSLIAPIEWMALATLVQQQSITAITWGSLGRGILTGKFDRRTTFRSNDSRSRDPDFVGERFLKNLEIADAVKNIARSRRVPTSQVALRFVLDTAGIGCSLFGAKTNEQVRENTESLQWELTSHEYASLQSLIGVCDENPENNAYAPGNAA